MEESIMGKENGYYTEPPETKENRLRRDAAIKLLQENEESFESLIIKLGEMGFKTSKPSLKKDFQYLNAHGYEIKSRKHKLSIKLPEVEESLFNIFNLDREIEKQIWDLQFRSLYWIATGDSVSFSTIQTNTNEDYDDCTCAGYYSDILNSRNPDDSSQISNYKLRRYCTGPFMSEGIIKYDQGSKSYRQNYKYMLKSIPEGCDEILKLLANNTALPKSVLDAFVRNLAENSFSTTDKERKNFYKIYDFLKLINHLDYIHNPLSFKTFNRSGKLVDNQFFYIGLISYSVEKDEVYLIGKASATAKENKIILLSSIERDPISDEFVISVSKNLNSLNLALSKKPSLFEDWQKEFATIKDEMFAISKDKPEDICIKIKYTDANYDEFLYLTKCRENTARLEVIEEENDSYLLYYDRIRGLGDFAKYLRKFGSDITVISDNTLKMQLQTTASNVLAKYGISTEDL